MNTSRPISHAPNDSYANPPVSNDLATFHTMHENVTDRISARIRGEDEAIRWGLIAAYAACHGLIFGGPGTGKTTFIKALAHAWGGSSRYLRGANDTMASDLTGAALPDIAQRKFWDIQGPLENVNFLLVDEITRYSPGALIALLDAQQDGEVTTASGDRRPLALPFVVLAALNPRDRGTTPLSKANDDRFGLSWRMGAPLVARDANDPRARDPRASRVRLKGGISDADLANRIRVGAPVSWRAKHDATAQEDESTPLYTPDDLAHIQQVVTGDIQVNEALDLAIAQLWRATCEYGEVEIGLRAPEVHRAVAQAYAATDPKGMRGWVIDADIRATWRAVYCGRLQDPTYTDAIGKLEDKLFGDTGVFAFPGSAANNDAVRYPAGASGNGRR